MWILCLGIGLNSMSRVSLGRKSARSPVIPCGFSHRKLGRGSYGNNQLDQNVFFVHFHALHLGCLLRFMGGDHDFGYLWVVSPEPLRLMSLGICTLLPYNCLLNAEPYFDQSLGWITGGMRDGWLPTM